MIQRVSRSSKSASHFLSRHSSHPWMRLSLRIGLIVNMLLQDRMAGYWLITWDPSMRVSGPTWSFFCVGVWPREMCCEGRMLWAELWLLREASLWVSQVCWWGRWWGRKGWSWGAWALYGWVWVLYRGSGLLYPASASPFPYNCCLWGGTAIRNVNRLMNRYLPGLYLRVHWSNLGSCFVWSYIVLWIALGIL